MAVDPKKMEAWLNKDAVPGTKSGGAKTKAEKPEPGSKLEEHMEEEENEPADEKEAEGDIEERYPALFPLLEEYGDIFEEATDSLDSELLASEDAEWDDENRGLLADAFETLPDDLQEALTKEGKNLSWEDAEEIAVALEAGEHIENVENVTGFLYYLGLQPGPAEEEGEGGEAAPPVEEDVPA